MQSGPVALLAFWLQRYESVATCCTGAPSAPVSTYTHLKPSLLPHQGTLALVTHWWRLTLLGKYFKRYPMCLEVQLYFLITTVQSNIFWGFLSCSRGWMTHFKILTQPDLDWHGSPVDWNFVKEWTCSCPEVCLQSFRAEPGARRRPQSPISGPRANEGLTDQRRGSPTSCCCQLKKRKMRTGDVVTYSKVPVTLHKLILMIQVIKGDDAFLQFEQKSSSERSGQCCFPSQA